MASSCSTTATTPNANVNPDATEVPYDGLDNDCTQYTRDDDLDRDGHFLADDCDDTDGGVHPGRNEVPYDGLDNDCDPATLDDDLDQDGFPLATDCNDDAPRREPGCDRGALRRPRQRLQPRHPRRRSGR